MPPANTDMDGNGWKWMEMDGKESQVYAIQ